MKKTLLILSFILLSVVSFAQRQRTTAVFDSDTTTRPKAGFYGIGVRANNIYFVPRTGNNIRLANYSLFTGLTTNYLSKWNGSKLVNSVVFESGGNVGIGIATPSVKLDVLSNVSLNSRFSRSSGTVLNISLDTDAGGTGANLFAVNSASSLYQPIVMAASSFKFTANGTEPNGLYITSSGNVGIGTTSPSKRLSIISTTNDYGQYLYGTGVSDNSFGLLIDAGTSSLDYPLRIRSQSTSELFTINGAGNVGVGTTTPTSKLQVVGLPTYADNAAATSGGLTYGAFYRTSTGVLMVVY